jgi:ABC-type lipoprotein export system ATPase subunit/GNAT superfamily N-acetyltransferase
MDAPGGVIAEGVRLNLWPDTLTLVTGPSGSGKSLVLAAIAGKCANSRWVSEVPFPTDVSVLDAVAPSRPTYEAIRILTACGLGEPMLWIRRFHQLSDGEQFRARLARAVSLHRRDARFAPLLCDEFAAGLHRRLARALSFNLRKLVRQEGIAMVVASSQENLAGDLNPDTIIRLGEGPASVESRMVKTYGKTVFSLAGELRIERGVVQDYEQFAAMHYRKRDQIGFVDKVFVLRELKSDRPLGIVVYGMPVLQLRLRNVVTGGRFVRDPALLNRELRVLKRLVVHPDIRGCGLGHYLVRRTLGRAGVRFVECLAAMAEVNPVFDKAGMRRIDTVAATSEQAAILAELHVLGADPMAADFVAQVCRRPAVRRVVTRAVFNWYRSATGAGRTRVERQSPAVLAQTYRQLAGSRPVYFIWSADRPGWTLIDRHSRVDWLGNSQPNAA